MKLKDTPTPDLCLMIAASRAGGDSNPVVINTLTAELEQRLSIEVDDSFEPSDFDAALARFLLAFIKERTTDE